MDDSLFVIDKTGGSLDIDSGLRDHNHSESFEISAQDDPLQVSAVTSPSPNLANCSDVSTEASSKHLDSRSTLLTNVSSSDFLGDKDEEEKTLERFVLGTEEQLLESLKTEPKVVRSSVKHRKRSETPATDTDNSRVERKAVWFDADDEIEDSTSRQSVTFGGATAAKRKRSDRLRTRFELTHSTPDWAALDNVRHDSDSDDELIRGTGDYLENSESLPPHNISVLLCTDANNQHPSQARCTSVDFHPFSQVILASSVDRSLGLFQIDGKDNPKLYRIYLERHPIDQAKFTTDGAQILMSSNRRYFHYLDVASEKIVKTKPVFVLGGQTMSKFSLSSDGKFLAFLSENSSAVHLFSAKTKEYLHSFQLNSPQASCCYFHPDATKLFAHGGQQVHMFDIRSHRCVHKFIDDGCVAGTSICVSPNNRYLVSGQESGVANVYSMDACLTETSPKPLRILKNLVTPCSLVQYSRNGEFFVIGSPEKRDAVKLVHSATLTVFSNFPSGQLVLKKPQCFSISPGSGYFAVGNEKGQVRLLRLKHYQSY